jgi:hypothetical protein
VTDFPYKLGCLPALFPASLHDLTYYAAGPLPKPPAEIPVPVFANWGLLGNQSYGDCGVAGLQHGLETDATVTQEKEKWWPSEQQAIDYYLKYTGGQDDGVVLSAYLAYVRQNGYYGKTVAAYAPVAVNDIVTLQTAVYLFDFAYAGITVYDGMMNAFSENETSCIWDTSQLDAVDGGHCIPIIAWDNQYLFAVTWGQVVRITYPCWHRIASEAWAVVTGELLERHGDGRGINIKALETDLALVDA